MPKDTAKLLFRLANRSRSLLGARARQDPDHADIAFMTCVLKYRLR